MTTIFNGTKGLGEGRSSGPPPGITQAEADGVSFQLVRLSSKDAAEWLEKYAGPNRRISENQVLKFQSDMESGRWHFEGAPLRLSKTSKLLDGRHRLTALANTVPEIEIDFLVVTGLDDSTQLFMDQGQARTVSQQLRLINIPNPTLCSSAGKLYLDWTRNRLFRSTSRGCTSKPEISQWVIDNQELLSKLSDVPLGRIDAPKSVVGAFALAVLQVNPVKGMEFFNRLASGAELHEGDPILALDRRLRNVRKFGQRLSSREYLALLIRAWNSWIMGDVVHKLQVPRLSEENFPELVTLSRDSEN